jgi:biotin carboxylase
MLPERVLIADRGLGAVRMQRALKALSVRSIQIHSAAERYAEFVLAADEAVCVGPKPLADSYLNAAAILDAARVTRARAVVCASSSLTDNPNFAEAVLRSGCQTLGPSVEVLRRLGDPVFLSTSSGLLIWDPARTPEAERTRFIEVSVIGNGADMRVLAGRDISARLDGRTLIAETPAPNLSPDVRKMLHAASAALGRVLGLVGLVTFEYALSGNQREPELVRAHARFEPSLVASETLYGVDFVELALRLAAGEFSPLELPKPSAHVLAARVDRDASDAGVISGLELPPGVFSDTWLGPGTRVLAEYDPGHCHDL